MQDQASSIKNFSDFGITIKTSFEGPKLYPEDLLDQEIIVHYYEIRPSKKDRGESDCLYVQITLNNEKRLLWSSSSYLMEALGNVPESGFPFKAKIIKINRHYEFRGC